MMKKEKQLSRADWWWMGLRLGLVSVLSITLALGSTLATPSPVQAAECRVSNPCVGCTHTSIQAAISGSSCDIIKVAQGTYSEKLYIDRAVTLSGGYLTSDWNTQGPASSTVINAAGKGDSAIWVTSGTGGTTTIENFTITGGTGHSYPGFHSRGGGIEVQASTVIIRNNIIQGNSADEGGGISIADNAGTPLPHQVLNNTITSNTATRANGIGWGGGMALNNSAAATIKYNSITNNAAYWGGGILMWRSTPTFDGNTITGNSALGSDSDSVGGAFFIEESAPAIKNNVIANNKAQRRADGIYIKLLYPYSSAQAQIVNNTIVNNRYADTDKHEGINIKGEGGDIISPIIRNNIVVLNGCGIRVFGDGTPAYPVLSNNDVWGNTVVNYAGVSSGPGDISADPLLVNWSGGDYHLQTGSPCINAGTSTNAPSTDFEGDPRPLDGGYDIGADEYATWFDKRANITAPDPGDTITYVITYRNNSTSTATGVVITDLLSTDLLSPSYTSSGASITLRGGTTYVWDVANLAPGSGGTITITAQVDPNVVTPAVVWNTAEFYVPGSGSFSDSALMIVGGLKTYLPLIFKNY